MGGKNKPTKPSKPNRPPAPASKKTSDGSGAKSVYLLCAGIVAIGAIGMQSSPSTVSDVLAMVGLRQSAVPEAPPVRQQQQQQQRSASKAQSQQPPPRKARTASKTPAAAVPSGPLDPGCVDADSNCEYWAKTGECDRNTGFMHSNCRASCHICNGGKPAPKKQGACEDTNAMCATWAAIGECQSNPGYMLGQCPVTCKMCQSDTCFDAWDDCPTRCRGGIDSNYSETLNCYYDPELVDKCAWTCGACKEHRFDRPACTRDRNAKAAASKKGDVNAIFQRIVDEVPQVTVLSSDPWVLLIDDFLSDAESDAVQRAGSNSGTSWERSKAGDGVQAARTSSTSWCKGRCMQDPTINTVEQRVTDLMGGIPMEHAEPMQVLRYEAGQFYKVHHDQNSPRASAWGPRMFTVFLYIGSGYTGGETRFPRLNITVPAKKGRVAVWTSVLDSDPYQRDDRTDHESLPVESGTKYGVNYWIHMYPFRTMGDKGCDNQAYVQNWY